MVAEKTIILSAEQEAQLRQPIDEYVGDIQAKINELRADGTDKVLDIQSTLETLKRDKIYTPQEKAERREELPGCSEAGQGGREPGTRRRSPLS